MNKKIIAILLSLMLFGGAALQTYNTKAASLSVSTNGPIRATSNSSAMLQVYWSNTQGESMLTAIKELNNISVSVSFGGFSYTTSKNSLSPGRSFRATKDVGYVHANLYGNAVYGITGN